MSRLEAIRDRAAKIVSAQALVDELLAAQEADVVEALRGREAQQNEIAEAAGRTREWVRRLRVSAGIPASPSRN